MSQPRISVVIVNFNGARYLPGLLESLRRQSYRDFEVLMVDNASTDESVDLVRTRFPEVRVIEAGGNLGFAGGNNLGIEHSRGAYVALINNDTIVDPQWLEKLVEAAEESPEVGAVGSKIVYARPFVPIRLEVETFSPLRQGVSGDSRELGVFVASASGFEGCGYQKPIHASGFFGPESILGTPGRWSGGEAVLWLPVAPPDAPGRLQLRLFVGEGVDPRELEVSIGESARFRLPVVPGWQEHTLELPASAIERESCEILNNAGSFLEPDGSAGDRGINAPDRGQFDRIEDVTALCGCSMLISSRALDRVGRLDTDYFMYFEDTELSWRLRKAGYRLRYQPESLVRHFHASTSVEWSPMFQFLVARNRVLMLLRHASPTRAIEAWLAEGLRLVRLLRSHRSLRHVDVRTRMRVQLSLLKLGPLTLLKRLGLRRP